MNTDQEVRKNNIKGALLMTAGFAAFSVADVVAKILTSDYHPIQIVVSRQLGLVLGVVFLVMIKGHVISRSVVPRLQIARGFCAILSAICFIFAIKYVPLADAVAVTFIAPFVVTALGATVLGEPVGLRRWGAICIGLIGTLIIIRPGHSAFHPAILLVIIAAIAFAARQIISRYIGTKDPTSTTMTYTSFTIILVLIIPSFFYWQAPKNIGDIALMVTIAGMAGFGEYLVIRALEIANAVVVAPTHYFLILFSTFWGFILFADLPDRWTWLGAGIVIISGLYVVARGHKVRS